MKDILKIARKIYRTSNSREARRMVVFLVRSVLNKGKMDKIDEFFHKNELRKKIAEIYPFVYEQPTRAFFYAGSTIDARAELLFDHFEYLEKNFKSNIILDIYAEKEILLYTKGFENDKLDFILRFYPGLRKEGLLSLCLKLNGTDLYQVVFWIGEDDKNNAALFIGAMQGPNGNNAKDIVKHATKLCYGYRTKNLSIYLTQIFTRALNLQKIYAVTNAGYYANNHIRLDRKLKTSFSDFWKEIGGIPTDDVRFFELPLTEERKSYEEIPTRKRAVYRRRFEFLDEVEENVTKTVKDEVRL
ncbi:MAG: DUF535 domain-containing protein [Selenomonadaceae bacterium]|nr:DUF535 domain-containing protein [Selenomonadaceae bacterium]MBP3721969.1 DUF535 domain-containing protein [Selenomonadaceae bacterium]